MKRFLLIIGLLMCFFPWSLVAGEIHDAVADTNKILVEQLLTEHPEWLEQKDDAGLTPLNYAAYYGDLDVFQFLLAQGADLENGDNEGSKPLHNASAGGQVEIVRYLLEQCNVDINQFDNNQVTPLLFAAGRGQLAVAQLLLEHGADVSLQSNRGSTPLHDVMFSRNVNIDLVRLLVEHDAPVNQANHWGVKPVHYAARRGTPEIIQLLRNHGADIFEETANGETPFIWAIVGQNLEVANFLIEQGTDPNQLFSHGRTALHSTDRLGRDGIQFLLDQGLDINAADTSGTTPLHHAIWNRDPEIIQFLIEQGADVNAVDNAGRTPLIWAARNDGCRATEILLANGAQIDPEACDNGNGCTFADGSALHIAAKNGNLEQVKLLAQSRKIVNMRDQRWERTPLHYAAVNGYCDIVEYLISKKAKLNYKDHFEKTALDYAQRHHHETICQRLVDCRGKAGRPSQLDCGNLLNCPVQEGEALIWYLNHSGWAIKTQNHFLIFDYWQNDRHADEPSIYSGQIVPDEIADENVMVFVSHEHRDHYDPIILDWQEKIPNLQYVFGYEPNPAESCTYIPSRTTQLVDGVKITTIESNDTGQGFLVELDGVTLLHPGDHANRHRDFSGNYLAEIDFLKQQNSAIDVAFMPISGCGFGDLEAVRLGVYRTLDELQPKVFFPMHAGGGEFRYGEFIEQAQESGCNSVMDCPLGRGDRFYLKQGKLVKM